MRLLTKLTLAAALVLFFGGCEKDGFRFDSCEKIKEGIVENDVEKLRQEINRITATYISRPTAQDEYGHQENLKEFIDGLDECGFTARMDCYNCIPTQPPKTEIFVTVQVGPSLYVNKVIELTYDSNKRLIFAGMRG